jgi:putative PIN family toxin of toxin-antitoxin system
LTRYVVDANILLSGFTAHPDAPSAVLVGAIQDDKLEAVACPEIIADVRKYLAKPYFRERLPEQQANKVLNTYVKVAVMLPDPINPEPILRDPDDDLLITLAQTAEADAIVTGDKDLLDHSGGLQPPAITVREACEQLGLPLST